MERKKSILQQNKRRASMKTVRFGGKITDILNNCNEVSEDNRTLLLKQLADPMSKSSQLLEWYRDCTLSAHMLDKKHNDVVNALLRVRWMEREVEVISQFREFVIALVTANPVHLRPVMKAVTKCFMPDVAMSSCESPVQDMEVVQTTIHQIFQTIFSLIPQSLSLAEKVFTEQFPFMRKPLTSLELYVKNLLFVTTYQPVMRPYLLELIVKNMVELDVHSPRMEIEDAEDADDEEEMFKMDEDVSPLDSIAGMKHDLANKLDVFLHLLFQYICAVCYVQGEFQIESSRKLFRELVAIFDSRILPVHQLNHVQFTIFYICSFKQSFFVSYVDYCWKKVANVNVPSVIRQTSACYIASLLARANYVPLNTVRATVDMMVDWCHRYLKEATDVLSAESYRCDVTRHGTFYSVCQAIFYLIVFRHQQILDSKLGRDYIQGLNLQHLIGSHLNPLKACLTTVVTLFASTMRMHQLVYCDTIIARNNKQMLPVVGMSSSTLKSSNPLECFFPFDPYLLKRSSSFITPLYNQWMGNIPATKDSHQEETEEQFLDVMEKESYSSSLDHSFKNIVPSPIDAGFRITPC